MAILQIHSSARLKDSNTRTLSQYLVNRLKQPVVTRDLAQHPLPPISAEDLIDVHGSSENQRNSLQQQLSLSTQLIDEIKLADTLVFGVAMYNFCIPASLKHWIDAICRSGVSFRYTAKGPVGLLDIKQAYIITSSGGTPIGSEMDFASRYMEHICHFIGTENIFHIDASGSKDSPEKIITQGKHQIDQLLSETQLNASSEHFSGVT